MNQWGLCCLLQLAVLGNVSGVGVHASRFLRCMHA